MLFRSGRMGRTPLHCVAQGRHLYSTDDGIHVAQLLLERGADANAADEDKRTPLHQASYHWKVEIAQVLLDGGASANSMDIQGQTPLHAVANGYSIDEGSSVLVARLLLERGADVNMPDDAKETPLHLASNSGRIKMVEALLNAGANARAKNAQDQSPSDVISRIYGVLHRHIARLLLEHGADVDVHDKNYATQSDFSALGDVFVPPSPSWESQSDRSSDGLRKYRREKSRHSPDSDSGKRMVATSKTTSLTIALQTSFFKFKRRASRSPHCQKQLKG